MNTWGQHRFNTFTTRTTSAATIPSVASRRRTKVAQPPLPHSRSRSRRVLSRATSEFEEKRLHYRLIQSIAITTSVGQPTRAHQAQPTRAHQAKLNQRALTKLNQRALTKLNRRALTKLNHWMLTKVPGPFFGAASAVPSATHIASGDSLFLNDRECLEDEPGTTSYHPVPRAALQQIGMEVS